MNKDILEGNKLIAAFIGWKLVCLNPDEPEEDHYVEYHRFDYKGEVVETHSGGDSWCWSKGQTIPFHSSWDWLMPVVEKCYSLCNDGKNPDMEVKLSEALLSCDIDELHAAVVQFIQWYNTQKHPTP